MLSYIAPLISSIGTVILAFITWWHIRSERQIKYNQITREQYIVVLQNILSVISYVDLLISNRQIAGLYSPIANQYWKENKIKELENFINSDSFKDLQEKYFPIKEEIRKIMLSIEHSGILINEVEEILLELENYIHNVADVVVGFNDKSFDDSERVNFHKKYKQEIKFNLGVIIKSKRFDINKFKWTKIEDGYVCKRRNLFKE